MHQDDYAFQPVSDFDTSSSLSDTSVSSLVLDLDLTFAIVSLDPKSTHPVVCCATPTAGELISAHNESFQSFCKDLPNSKARIWEVDSNHSVKVECTSFPGAYSKVYIFSFTQKEEEPTESTKNLGGKSASMGLTKRESQVFELMSKGLSNREIANTLNISYYTACAHLRNIFSTLNVTNRIEAANVVFGKKAQPVLQSSY